MNFTSLKPVAALLAAALALSLPAAAQTEANKKQQDREAILSMAGCYRVTFDFAETFSADTAYDYRDRYKADATEYVTIVENSENRVVLQHLLIIQGEAVIKHWRQDWDFENTEVRDYVGYNTWKTRQLDKQAVKGQWTQKVYQVDDAPRYESSGTWVHLNGRHYWESVATSPLPRREHTIRSDYNMLERGNRLELIPGGGWKFLQDNRKIIIDKEGKQQELVCERGLETYTPLSGEKCGLPKEWWDKSHVFWSDVRAVWTEIFTQYPTLTLNEEVNGKQLWQSIYKVGVEAQQDKKVKPGEYRKKVRAAIEPYIVKG